MVNRLTKLIPQKFLCNFTACRNYRSIHYASTNARKPRICIIGSGPAGFYTAQHILKHHKEAFVDIFEKLPVPFGLIRYGVAPDHPEVKNTINSFENTVRNDRCRFFGNVNVGDDIKAVELRDIYDGVVFAYGADDDKKLNIPGEDANGVYPARTFVGWYNGLPAHANLKPNLDCDTAIIIGQGNVALDVARILFTAENILQHTDISANALQSLSRSKVKHINIIGRRSPLEISFTIKELREMTRLDGVESILNPDDFLHIKPLIPLLPRQRKRLIDLMCKLALDDNKKVVADASQWQLQFLKSPVEIITDVENNVCGIKLERNKLVESDDGVISAVGTNEFEIIECGMVLRSIGYKSIHIEKGIPFDIRLGIIPNMNGRVVEQSSKNIVKGLYCSGWVKHGPVGVIATTMNESFSTAENIIDDINSGSIMTFGKNEMDVKLLLKDRGVNYVTFDDYEKIDQEEIFRGKQQNKPREKITSEAEMLSIAKEK